MEKNHSCKEGIGTLDHPRAFKHWVSSVISDKLEQRPLYQIIDFQNNIHDEYEEQILYHRAWWDKVEAWKHMFENEQYSFNQLHVYHEAILKTNLGIFVHLQSNSEIGRFERLFVAFDASIVGFQMGCRPLLFLDRAILKSKYQGVRLGAMTLNGENEIFSLAFGVVDVETDEKWKWFLSDMKKIVDKNARLTFVFDRCNWVLQF